MFLHRVLTAFALLAVFCVATFLRSAIYESEVTLYSDIIAKSPDKSRPHNNLGDALKKVNRFSEAGSEFERALELQPDYPDALNNLATIYGSFNRKEESIRMLGRALALDPGHKQARFNLAMTYYERGMQADAEQHFAVLFRTAPESKEGVFAAKMLALMRKGRVP